MTGRPMISLDITAIQGSYPTGHAEVERHRIGS